MLKATKISIRGTFKKLNSASSKCSGCSGMHQQGSYSHEAYLLEYQGQQTSVKIKLSQGVIVHEDNTTGQCEKNK